MNDHLSSIKLGVMIAAFLCLKGCTDGPLPSVDITPAQGEYIVRRHDERGVVIAPPRHLQRPPYPWELRSPDGNIPSSSSGHPSASKNPPSK